MADQEQKGGIGSTNLQVRNLYAGMSYGDVRDIARDVFVANMQMFDERARQISDARAAELREELIAELSSKPAEALETFSQPEKQSALFEAQKGYALSGDQDLRTSLVKMLGELSGADERSIKSIALQEAIKVAPILTRTQIRAISIVFLLRYVNVSGVQDLKQYADRIEKCLGESHISGRITQGDLRHIEYTRCGIAEMGEINLGHLLRSEYPGLVSKGYGEGELPLAFSATGIPIGGISSCFFDTSRYQVSSPNIRSLNNLAQALRWSDEQLRIATERLLDPNSLLDDQLIADVSVPKAGSNLAEIAKDWDQANLKHMKLTSVGLTIAHSYTLSKVNDPADLMIWL